MTSRDPSAAGNPTGDTASTATIGAPETAPSRAERATSAPESKPASSATGSGGEWFADVTASTPIDLRNTWFGEYFQWSARYFADSILFRRPLGGDRIEEMTYREFGQIVLRAAKGLVELGHGGPDKRIAIVGPNTPYWCAAYAAAATTGSVLVPLDNLLQANEIAALLDLSRPSVLIATRKHIENLQAYWAKHEDEDQGAHYRPALIGLGPTENVERPVEPWDYLLACGDRSTASEPARRDPNDLAVLIYTSGTTGASKGVMLSHRNLLSNVEQVQGGLEFSQNDTFISLLPLHHTFEATCGFLVPLSRGCKVGHARGLKPNEIVEDIKQIGATIMLGVPLLYDKMLAGVHRKLKQASVGKRTYVGTGLFLNRFFKNTLNWFGFGKVWFAPLRKKAGMNTLRLLVSGGGPLDWKTSMGFNLLGFKLLQGYGLTETSPVTNINRPTGGDRYKSVGPALPTVEIKIDSPNAEGVGEILIRGDNIMLGYVDNPEATAEVLMPDRWLRTGDLGKVERGHTYICGRSKALIITRAGKNVYPEEIEAVLNRSAFILESLAVGRKFQDSTGEEVTAWVVPDLTAVEAWLQSQGVTDFDINEPTKNVGTKAKIEKLMRDEVARMCEALASYKRPHEIAVRYEEFEKTSTRKVKRFLYSAPEKSAREA